MNDFWPEPISLRAPSTWLVVGVLAFLALLPLYVYWASQPFYLTLFARIMIYGLAAVSLNLLVGYTGLVSLGHALYLGLGAYAVGLWSFHEINNGWLQLLTALGASATVAAVTGAICLRTSGMGFIMITLAFAQMFYFLGISLKQYGGDDGMRLTVRSDLAPLSLTSNYALYYVIFGCLLALLYGSWRLVHARLGYILRGIKTNERRMQALGYNTRRYKLLAYVLASMIASVAGFLLANLTSYTSPAYSAWTVSGELVVMVVLGGMGTIFGPLVGAMGLLLFEEYLSSFPLKAIAEHWMLFLGALIVIIVRVARRGLYGSLREWSLRRVTGGSTDKVGSSARTAGDGP